jgi:hypothetical protein
MDPAAKAFVADYQRIEKPKTPFFLTGGRSYTGPHEIGPHFSWEEPERNSFAAVSLHLRMRRETPRKHHIRACVHKEDNRRKEHARTQNTPSHRSFRHPVHWHTLFSKDIST